MRRRALLACICASLCRCGSAFEGDDEPALCYKVRAFARLQPSTCAMCIHRKILTLAIHQTLLSWHLVDRSIHCAWMQRNARTAPACASEVHVQQPALTAEPSTPFTPAASLGNFGRGHGRAILCTHRPLSASAPESDWSRWRRLLWQVASRHAYTKDDPVAGWKIERGNHLDGLPECLWSRSLLCLRLSAATIRKYRQLRRGRRERLHDLRRGLARVHGHH